MVLRHRVCVNISDSGGDREPVIRSGTLTLPRRLVYWLLGEPVEVLVLKPGKSVTSVEIYQQKEGDTDNERYERAFPDSRGTAHVGAGTDQRGRQPRPAV